MRRAKSFSLNIGRCEGSVFVDLNSYHLKLHRIAYDGFRVRFVIDAKCCQRYTYPYKRKPAGEILVSLYPILPNVLDAGKSLDYWLSMRAEGDREPCPYHVRFNACSPPAYAVRDAYPCKEYSRSLF